MDDELLGLGNVFAGHAESGFFIEIPELQAGAVLEGDGLVFDGGEFGEVVAEAELIGFGGFPDFFDD